MYRDHRLFLDDIKECAEKVVRYTAGLSLESLRLDSKTFDAVARNLEIMGEAARHIPQEVRERHPGVEWQKLTALRNIVAHEYFGLDYEILWDIIQNHIPKLLEQFADIVGEEEGEAE